MIRRKPLVRKKQLGPGKVRMRIGRSTNAPTVAQRERWDAMREIGCLACLVNADEERPTLIPHAPKLDIHHFTNGGRRLGHDQTICLCQYHHKGDWWPFESAGYAANNAIFGPSYHRCKKAFHEVYGCDADLLARQNKLLRWLYE